MYDTKKIISLPELNCWYTLSRVCVCVRGVCACWADDVPCNPTPSSHRFLQTMNVEKGGLPNLELQLTQTVGKWRLAVSLEGQRHLSPFFSRREAHLLPDETALTIHRCESREKVFYIFIFFRIAGHAGTSIKGKRVGGGGMETLVTPTLPRGVGRLSTSSSSGFVREKGKKNNNNKKKTLQKLL